MNFLTVATFATLTALVSAAFRAGEFVRLQGLEGNRMNGAYAAVMKDHKPTENERVQVLAVIDSKVSGFDPTSMNDFSAADYFFNTLVKPENLTRFEWNNPQPRPVEEIIAAAVAGLNVSNWVTAPVTPEGRVILDRVVALLQKIHKNDSEKILSDEAISLRFRAIGAWICQNFGFEAMRYVCRSDPSMHPYILRVWDGIGVWQG